MSGTIRFGDTVMHYDAGRDAFGQQRHYHKMTDSKCIHGKSEMQPCDKCYAINAEPRPEPTPELVTPPTVGQPPVAEGIMDQCAKAGYNARRVKTHGIPWEARGADDRRRYREIAEAAVNEYRRLAQARSAPPSEMVLVSRDDLTWAAEAADQYLAIIGPPDSDVDWGAPLTRIRTALAAPSGGPDVE